MTLRSSIVLRSLLASALLLLSGCSTPENWQQLDSDESFESLWREFADSAAARGYRTDFSGTDRGLRTYQSAWREKVIGNLGQTARVRLLGRFERVPGDDASWRVEYRVEKQSVSDMSRTQQPTEEDYEPDGEDVLEGRQFGAQLRSRLGIDQLAVPAPERSL